jgi:hypothetical protein
VRTHWTEVRYSELVACRCHSSSALCATPAFGRQVFLYILFLSGHRAANVLLPGAACSLTSALRSGDVGRYENSTCHMSPCSAARCGTLHFGHVEQRRDNGSAQNTQPLPMPHPARLPSRTTASAAGPPHHSARSSRLSCITGIALAVW